MEGEAGTQGNIRLRVSTCSVKWKQRPQLRLGKDYGRGGRPVPGHMKRGMKAGDILMGKS